jgi:hypothetical protein
MADPVRIVTPKGVWTPIALNIIMGAADLITRSPSAYYFTTRVAGSAVPVKTDPDEAGFTGSPKFLEGRRTELDAPEPTDFYVMCTGTDGMVEVTL